MSSSANASRTRIVKLLALHAEIDQKAAAIQAGLPPLTCKRGCSECCVDDLTVFEVEAERIRQQFPQVLAQAPHPVGACAFLDQRGACRVYDARPYVCRTQGLPLAWFEEDELQDAAPIVEHRDICHLNEGSVHLTVLNEASTWVLGPFEERLCVLEAAQSPTKRPRVALRSLFG